MSEDKRCGRCKMIKPLDEFYKSSKRRDGHGWCCKVCQKECFQMWARKNRESRKKYFQMWVEKNRNSRARLKCMKRKSKKKMVESGKRMRHRRKTAAKYRYNFVKKMKHKIDNIMIPKSKTPEEINAWIKTRKWLVSFIENDKIFDGSIGLKNRFSDKTHILIPKMKLDRLDKKLNRLKKQIQISADLLSLEKKLRKNSVLILKKNLLTKRDRKLITDALTKGKITQHHKPIWRRLKALEVNGG